MGYENAPATKLLATHCACCARELLDAESVSVGIGPECRKKYALPKALSDKVRKRANKLVYQIAAKQTGDEVIEAIKELEKLGCDKIVARIKDRVLGKGKVEFSVVDGERIAVETPWDFGFIQAVRKIRGRKWDAENKVNTFPLVKWQEVYALIYECFTNKRLVTADGDEVICSDLPHPDKIKHKDLGLPKPPKNAPVEKVTIRVVRDGNRIAVFTPYDGGLVNEFRDIPGRKWNKYDKVNTFPADSEDNVLEIVTRYFPGATIQQQS